MSEAQTAYGVSYIASAPEELKVGDRVEVVFERSNFFGMIGIVRKLISPDMISVSFD